MKENDKSLVRDKMNSVKNIMSLLKLMWNSFTLDLSPTAQFWSVYTDMVLIMKRYILSERSGNWLGHLEEVCNMIPYIVSAKHNKYSVCLSLYLCDMEKLSESYPGVYEQFQKGNFSLRQTEGRFNGVWSDLAL